MQYFFAYIFITDIFRDILKKTNNCITHYKRENSGVNVFMENMCDEQSVNDWRIYQNKRAHNRGLSDFGLNDSVGLKNGPVSGVGNSPFMYPNKLCMEGCEEAKSLHTIHFIH